MSTPCNDNTEEHLVKIASLLVALMMALTACAGGSDKAAPAGPVDLSTVTLKVGDQRAISIEVLMKASGQLASLPYKVEFSTFTAGPPLVEAASAGGIHLAQVGNTPACSGRLPARTSNSSARCRPPGRGTRSWWPSSHRWWGWPT